MTTTKAIHPVYKKDRIVSLDILRGIAILGILILNIQSFSMPSAAYINPMAYGDMTGMNKWVWMLSHVFGDQKFMSIFSILFGAGIVLFSENAQRKIGRSAGLHYSRTFWLLLIGLVHAHIIWHGDILVAYALCGFIVYLFRRLNPKALLILGLLIIGVHAVIYLFFGFTMGFWPPESIAETNKSWLPATEAIQREIAAYHGSFSQQFAQRSASAFFLETFVFLTSTLWRAGGLMLVGMALYKWGILSAEKSKAFYKKAFVISWLVGLPIVIYGVLQNYAHNWAMEYSMFIGSQFNYLGSLFVSFGFICLTMLLVKSRKLQGLKDRLAAIGRMALTNYLLQSIICAFIFYGMGLGLFGKVERIWQIAIVVGIWLAQFLWSLPWLQRYNFGPFEWLWRSLTYRKRQAFKKS